MNVSKLWLCVSPVLDCYWQRLLTPNQQLATYQYSEQSHMFGLLGMACLTTMWMICNPPGRGCWRAADISQRYIKRGTAQLVVQVLRQLLHDEDWFAAYGCISCSRICQSNWTSIRYTVWVGLLHVNIAQAQSEVVVLGKMVPPVAMWHHHRTLPAWLCVSTHRGVPLYTDIGSPWLQSKVTQIFSTWLGVNGVCHHWIASLGMSLCVWK